MEFPNTLRISIEAKMKGLRMEQLKQVAKKMSDRYRNESGMGKRLVTTEVEALVYALVRMPATFGAVSAALSYTLNAVNCNISSLLDVGAGTGAATWAAEALLSLTKVTCLERETAMKNLGQQLMQTGSVTLQNARWVTTDLITDELPWQADLVISSYVLNEMEEGNREKVLKKLWDSTKEVLLIIEPGTPVGHAQINKAREILVAQGGYVAAPCPNGNCCQMEVGDWCHFTTRVQRSKIHKLLKEGDVPYEDEKFSYMVFTKKCPSPAQTRVLRHPFIEKGRVILDVCTRDGIKKVVIRKHDRELFKNARKVKCGDEINL